ncbi:hypothetical protein V5740_04660 [Croceibacterium sp. TMG7-5b_MA50]|uniref:hypothetical protein n=1 Tax=Croceibacterium sp. TMG7-5b_MA50 TaxID=3121290 RepID=UPI0032216B57
MSDFAASLRANGRWPATAISAVVFAALLVRSIGVLSAGEWLFTGRLLFACLLAGGLYILAHLMRAFRLAVIAMPLTGASFRTLVLLHLFVAPWSLVLPFKLDELIRLSELARIAKSWSRAIIVLVIDRSMDGVVLIGLALLLLASGGWNAAIPVALAGAGLTLLVLAFFVLPVLLEQVQRHIFVNHYQDRALSVLAKVSKARGMLDISRQVISAAPAFLVLATLGIWSMELVAVGAILAALDPQLLSTGGTVAATLGRADASWRVLLLGDLSPRALALATFVFFDAMLLVWIWVPLPYGRRQQAEPRRVRLPGADGIALPAAGKA